MKKNLGIINKNLEKHAILLDIKDDELQKIKTKDGVKIDLTRKFLRRTFNNSSFTQGGRFYRGWWQQIPREYRKYIRIGDKDVVELDYSGLHIHMLYAMEKLPMPEGDVYHLDGYSNDSTFRNFVKRMLLIMVNANGKDVVCKALHDEVHHKKQLKLPYEIGSTKRKDLDPLMTAFESKHKPIKHYFCSGKGIDLQYLDSKIAEKVMLQFSKWGYAILPMHDSFIIHHGLEGELKKAMKDAFLKELGIPCNVDLKYSSISERQKEDGQPERPCDASIKELLDDHSEDGDRGAYHRYLNQHRKYLYDPKPPEAEEIPELPPDMA
jgi:hypothetical protein